MSRATFFHRAGLLILLLVGLVRPVAYLAVPGDARYAIVSHGVLKALSPLPLVFDRPAFFYLRTIELITAKNRVPIDLAQLSRAHPWLTQSAAYLHFFLRLRPEGLNERELALGRRLFCAPAIYPVAVPEILAVELGVERKRSGEFYRVSAEIKCSGQ